MAKKEEILDAAKKVAVKAAEAALDVAEKVLDKAAEVTEQVQAAAAEAVKEATTPVITPKDAKIPEGPLELKWTN
jgi:Tfp pilus assembly protein PilX